MIIPISDYWTDEQIAEVIQRIIEEEEEEEK